jgi:L-iditol 2-dehydrogenase
MPELLTGLATLLTAKAMGATELVITDLIASKLDTAADLGATQVLQVDS